MSRRSVVVLMPFAPGFLPAYDQAIKPACSAAGVECIRVDEQLFGENVMQRLYHDIDSADIVVADMTGCNVNVFYEVGYAHGRKKDVILLTRNANDIPYDLKQYQTVVYDEDLHVLQQRLQRWLEHYATNPTRRVREIRTVFGPAAVDETEGVTVTIPVFHPASHDDYVEAESWVWKVHRPYQGPERRSRQPLYSPIFVLEDSLAYEESTSRSRPPASRDPPACRAPLRRANSRRHQ